MDQANVNQVTPRRNRAQLLELLREFDNSHGMTVKAFCKLHQISEGSFFSARKRYGTSVTSQPKQSGFIAIAPQPFKESADRLFAEVKGIRLYQAVAADYLKALIV